MKKVLILGVNGFIGHHLSKRILETTDWEVYGMDMQTERLGDMINHPRMHFFEVTLPSIKNGLSIMLKNAMSFCHWLPSQHHPLTLNNHCAFSNSISKRTCQSSALQPSMASIWFSHLLLKSMACATMKNLTQKNPN